MNEPGMESAAQPFARMSDTRPRSTAARVLYRVGDFVRELHRDFKRLSPLRKWQLSLSCSLFLGFCLGLIVMAIARSGGPARHHSPPPQPPPPPFPPSQPPPSPTPLSPPPHWLHQETFLSDPIQLAPGQLYFGHHILPMPNGTFAITAFRAEGVVEESGKRVPLDQVQLHAWHFYLRNKAGKPVHTDPFCPLRLDQLFEAAPESLLSPIAFPHGYGYVMKDDDRQFHSTINLIRTEGLSGSDAARAAKECAECYYAPGKGPKCTSPAANGTLACCGEEAADGQATCATDTAAAAALGNRTVRRCDGWPWLCVAAASLPPPAAAVPADRLFSLCCGRRPCLQCRREWTLVLWKGWGGLPGAWRS